MAGRFRHFERFSYMPKLIAGMGESLTDTVVRYIVSTREV